MFSNTLRSAARTALRTAPVVAKPSAPGIAARGMAVNLAELRKRIAATSNVAQLTGVMKLVAASKLKGVETRLEEGRPFGQGLMNSVSFKQVVDPEDEDYDPDSIVGESKEIMFMVVTTDRGLCGGVNSQIIRATRSEMSRYEAAGHACKMFVLGEKGRSGLIRTHATKFTRSIDSAFDKDVTFPLAAEIAGFAVQESFDELVMIYNTYENVAKFAITARSFPKIAGLPVGHRPAIFHNWEVEPEDNEEALANMEEYALAGSIYGALLESQCCEMASRMTAMDNATSNATEMVERFTLQYNRARQAKITTELVEIISGAESLAASLEEE